MRRHFLAFSLLLSAPPALQLEGAGRFSLDSSSIGVALGAPLPPVGGAEVLSPPRGLPLPLKPPGLGPPPFGFTTLTGVLTPFPFRLPWFFGIAAFYVAFISIMPPFAAISARYCAAEMVLVLYLLTIFGFLCAL